jgi:hypothetical protein
MARAQTQADTLVLVWTAPGDDGMVGTATSYDVRWSTSPITAQNWTSANVVAAPPTPEASGARQHLVVRNLTPGTTYYFAIRSTDDAGNQSDLSNVVRWDWEYDTAAPAAPVNVTATREGDDVRVRWSANAEPDLASYTVYRRLGDSGSFAVVAGPVTGTEHVDATIPPGTESVWYRVTARDDSGNESAQSAAVAVNFTTVAAGWTVGAAYPNPGRAGSPVSIPIVVPSTGSAGAELRILDAGGHVVRRLELGSYDPGPQTVAWDGRNEAGRTLAPGVFTAWLIAGGERKSVKLVRVP